MTSAPPTLRKYPRTRHLAGSALQPGDDDLSQVAFADLSGLHLVVEEKIDGANCAVSFASGGSLWLQSRGHFLTGGPRERHFDQFKRWAATHQAVLQSVLGDRYVMYGEWMAAKHTVFYDALPHYFFEFDVYDRETDTFLDTPARHALLAPAPVVHVPVLYTGTLASLGQLTNLVGPSLYQSATWLDSLDAAARAAGQDPDRVRAQTDLTGLAEGLYIKVEYDGVVTDRVKWVRNDFTTKITTPTAESGHWLDRPIVDNGLAPGVDLYAPELT